MPCLFKMLNILPHELDIMGILGIIVGVKSNIWADILNKCEL